MLGYIAKVRRTGRHDVDTFPYAITVDSGVLCAGTGPCETRHRAIFVDNYSKPTKFAFSTIYDPEEVEEWITRVSYSRLAELDCMAQKGVD